MKQLRVTIHKGQTTVTAIGYKGESCKNATSALEKALGKVVADEPTQEMYETEVEQREYEQEG